MNQKIILQSVSKRYRIGKSSLNFRSLFKNNKSEEKFHWAVKDINFNLGTGEALGIIGPNGAGKTTILKLLSRVTSPTSGKIEMNGRYSALIELGAGFHPDLSGRENVFLNGTILGMRKSEIEKRFDQIVDFAGIEKYIDTPVKRYSSGMYARLGFSVAAHVDPEILIVDEVLAVGDMAFQKKCYDRMLDLIHKGTTLVFVSHNMRAIQKVCSRSIVLYRGTMAFEGSSSDATAEYSNILRKAASENAETTFENLSDGIGQRIMTQKAIIEKVELLNDDGLRCLSYRSGESARVRAIVRFSEFAQSPVIACSIRDPEGLIVYDFTTEWAQIKTPNFEANTTATIEFPIELNLSSGTFQLGVNLAYKDLSRYYDRIDRALDFVIVSSNGSRGISDLKAKIEIKNQSGEPL